MNVAQIRTFFWISVGGSPGDVHIGSESQGGLWFYDPNFCKYPAFEEDRGQSHCPKRPHGAPVVTEVVSHGARAISVGKTPRLTSWAPACKATRSERSTPGSWLELKWSYLAEQVNSVREVRSQSSRVSRVSLGCLFCFLTSLTTCLQTFSGKPLAAPGQGVGSCC